jgi:recombinational DNA repair protein (RecF pathway)
MPTVRRHSPGIDKPQCEECSDRAEVVIEEYPSPHHHRSLCRDCAIAALQVHPNLLASLVITLMLRSERPVLAMVR